MENKLSIDRYEILANLCSIVKAADNKEAVLTNIDRIKQLCRYTSQFLTYKESTLYKDLLTNFYPVRDTNCNKEEYKEKFHVLAETASALAGEMISNSPELGKALPQKRQKVLVDFSNLKEALEGKFETKKTHTIEGLDLSVIKKKPVMKNFLAWAKELTPENNKQVLNVNIDIFNSYKCGYSTDVVIDWDMMCVNITTTAYIELVNIDEISITSGIKGHLDIAKCSVSSDMKYFANSSKYLYMVRIKKLHTEGKAYICVIPVPTAEITLNNNSAIARIRTIEAEDDNEEPLSIA